MLKNQLIKTLKKFKIYINKTIRQYYFAEKKFLNYAKNYHLCKDNENFAMLNSNSAQQTMKVVDRNFRSFFSLIELAKKGQCFNRGYT